MDSFKFLYYNFLRNVIQNRETIVIVRKDKVLQVRVDEASLQQFEESCASLGVRPTARIRALMSADFLLYQKKLANQAKSPASSFKDRGAASVLVSSQKSPVASPVKPVSLSERLKAEREAKKLKKKKREDKWLHD